MKNIEELTKKLFFKYFKEISDIPRGSGNEKEISDYLVDFAKQRSLEVIQDKYNNVIIKKEATKGYENIPAIILQGHMDMVCVKTSNSKHNFEKDPIKLNILGDMIYAEDTTLGADNGVALAYALAILDLDNLKHPKLEIVITTEEESTMLGVMNLDTSFLSGKIMINLDSTEDDKLLVSSTGGIVTMKKIEIEWIDKQEQYTSYELLIDGLIGGHSGEEIHKQRGNANKILGRVLNDINNKFDIQLSAINGGTSSNAIPREASAIIYIDKNEYEKVNELIKNINETIKSEFNIADKEMSISLKELKSESQNKVFSRTTLNKLISLIMLIPNGVQSMSMNVDGLVESSNNLGVIRTNKDFVLVESEIRSCVKSKRIEIEEKIKKLSEILDINYSTRDEYPEWNYKSDSVIREVFKNSYKKICNEEVELEAVHAGLETGVFLEKMPDLDIISYGPNAYELHNPKEHLSISSCLKTWDVLIHVLENTINYY